MSHAQGQRSVAVEHSHSNDKDTGSDLKKKQKNGKDLLWLEQTPQEAKTLGQQGLNSYHITLH